MQSTISELFFKVANVKDSELEACEYLDLFAKKCGYQQESIDEMRLAFIEGLINAKEHAPKDLPEDDKSHKEIDVSFSFADDLLTINIRDYGKGFDPTAVEKPDIRKKLKSSYKRGWGIMLMERLMDGYEITSFPPSGTLMHLVKKRVDPAAQTEAEKNAEIEKKRVERLKYILGSCIDLSSFLCQSKNLESGLRSMLRILLGTLGVSRGAIYTFEKEFKSLECLVDIKLRANARLPQVSITPETFDKLISNENVDIATLVKDEINQFRDNFKDNEIEHIYLLKSEENWLGLLLLGSRFHVEEGPFDVELLKIITRNISSAMNTYRLMQNLRIANEALDERIKELYSIREASQVISSELEVTNLPATVEAIFKNVMGITKFSMSMFDPGLSRFTVCKNERNLPVSIDPWSSPVSQYVIDNKEPLFVADINTEKRFKFGRRHHYSTDSFIIIPVVVANEVIALVNLTDKKDNKPLTERDFEMAKLLCSQLGVALNNASLYKKGISDSMTGLYTSHYMQVRITQEISRMRRTKSPLSIIMGTIDNLNFYVEKYGIMCRDKLLEEAGNSVRKVVRYNDIPCRFDGDKLLVILPDTEQEGADAAAEKLHKTLTSSFKAAKIIDEEITVSIVAACYDLSMSQVQFMENTEAMLHKVQMEGGNRVITKLGN